MITPIIFYTSIDKIYPYRPYTLYGVNLKGNIALNFGGADYLFPGNLSETTLEVLPQILNAGRYKLKVAHYEVNDSIITVGDYSNEIDLYYYDTIQDARNNYCPKFTEKAYIGAMLKLMPRGLFALNEDSNIYKLMNVLALEAKNNDEQVCTLKSETNPLTTDQFLPMWETEYGLPENCSNVDNSDIAYRKKELERKYLSFGGSSPAYFEYVAYIAGFTIKIEDNSVDMMTCEDTCEDAVIAEEMNFVWYVDVYGYETNVMTCEDTCEDALDWVDGGDIECFMNGIKPSHTIIFFRYTNETFYLLTDIGNRLITDEGNLLIHG